MKKYFKKIINGFSKRENLYKNLFVIILFLLLPYLFFKDAFIINNYFYGQGDALIQNFPIRYHIIQSLKNLEFPLWNPHNFSGMPLFADIQGGVLYLPNIIIGLFFPSILVAFNISTFLHYSLAGIFTFLFVREYKISRIASFAAGLIFMFCGFMVIRKSHSQMLYTCVWLPLILLFIERYKNTKKARFILFGSLVTALQFFAGSPQIFLYSSIIVLLYILFLFLTPENKENIRQRLYILNCFWIFFIFFLLSVVQLLPTYELLQLSARTKLNYESFSLFSFNPKSLPLLFLPYIYGKINPEQYKEVTLMFAGNGGEETIFIGFLPFFLALTGFFKKCRYKFFWGIVCFLSLIVILGKFTPVNKIIYMIPIVNSFRIPSRHWFEFSFGLSVMAGFGFDYILRDLNDKKFSRNIKIIISTILSLGIVLIVFFLFFLFKTPDGSYLGHSIQDFKQTISFSKPTIYIPLIFFIVCIIFYILIINFKKYSPKVRNIFIVILLIVIFLELFSFGYDFEPYINMNVKPLFEESKYSNGIKFLTEDKSIFRIFPIIYPFSASVDPVNNAYFNLNMLYGLDSIGGNNPFILKDYSYFADLRPEGINNNYQEIIKNNNILSAMNVKYILIPQLDYKEEINEIFQEEYLILSEPLIDTEIISKNCGDLGSFSFDSGSNSIRIKSSGNSLKVLRVPIKLKENTDYILSFCISGSRLKENSPDPNIHFDFFSNNYDNPQQEVIANTKDLSKDFKTMEFIINSATIPKDTEIDFRIFLWQPGDYIIKDIEVREILDKEYKSDYKKIKNLDNPHIYLNKKYLGRFYFVENIIEVNNLEEAKKVFLSKDFNPEKSATVENFERVEKKYLYPEVNKYKIMSYNDNSVVLEVNMKNNGFLVFSDSFYPGWRAYLNNKEIKIYRANGVFKGVFIPQGKHTLKFVFFPRSFWIGLIISSVTLLALICIFLVIYKKSKYRI